MNRVTIKIVMAGWLALFLFFSIASLMLHVLFWSGMMSDCPFMGQTLGVCNMRAIEHVTRWQYLFSTIVPSVMVVLTLCSVAFIMANLLSRPSPDAQIPQRSNKEKTPAIKLFDKLGLAFSRGILHPRLYA